MEVTFCALPSFPGLTLRRCSRCTETITVRLHRGARSSSRGAESKDFCVACGLRLLRATGSVLFFDFVVFKWLQNPVLYARTILRARRARGSFQRDKCQSLISKGKKLIICHRQICGSSSALPLGIFFFSFRLFHLSNFHSKTIIRVGTTLAYMLTGLALQIWIMQGLTKPSNGCILWQNQNVCFCIGI